MYTEACIIASGADHNAEGFKEKVDNFKKKLEDLIAFRKHHTFPGSDDPIGKEQHELLTHLHGPKIAGIILDPAAATKKELEDIINAGKIGLNYSNRLMLEYQTKRKIDGDI